MEYRFVGDSGIKASVIGLGNWLTEAKCPQELSDQSIKRALDLGINLFDTAESYGGGNGEILMGNSFKKIGERREDLLINTKIWTKEFS